MKRNYYLIALIISILSLLGENSLAQSSADNYLVLVPSTGADMQQSFMCGVSVPYKSIAKNI